MSILAAQRKAQGNRLEFLAQIRLSATNHRVIHDKIDGARRRTVEKSGASGSLIPC